MLEALYGLEFVSSVNIGGYGVVVLETGRVLGGDSSFIFIGSYEVKNGVVSAQITCTNDRNVLGSIFGSVNVFNVCLTGKPDNYNEFTLAGSMVEDPLKTIQVTFTRRAELP
jgi:hypothetical protein